jgi:hypothetical protein
MNLSQPLKQYLIDIEKHSGNKITILDNKLHPEWQLKASAFVDGNTIYIDKTKTPHDYEEALFHELTHVFFRHSGYPQITVKSAPTAFQQQILDKILSLSEDILVDKYLEERNFTYDKYVYDDEYKKVVDIDDAGKYIKIGSGNYSPELKMLFGELMFIKLLIDDAHIKSNTQRIKEICVKNLGEDEWMFIKKVSDGLRDISSQSGTEKDKLQKTFKFLISKYNLKDVYAVL